MSLGLYLHIPYCFSKCRYCDFYSHPGERGVPDAYVDALLRELARFAPDAPLRPDTVYFGGGTPSLLSPAQVGRLIRAACPLSGGKKTEKQKGKWISRVHDVTLGYPLFIADNQIFQHGSVKLSKVHLLSGMFA